MLHLHTVLYCCRLVSQQSLRHSGGGGAMQRDTNCEGYPHKASSENSFFFFVIRYPTVPNSPICVYIYIYIYVTFTDFGAQCMYYLYTWVARVTITWALGVVLRRSQKFSLRAHKAFNRISSMF